VNVTNLTTNLQVEISNYIRKFSKDVSKPAYKFIKDSLNGILRSKSIFISKIASHLSENIAQKKIEERLLYHFSKKNTHKQLTELYYESNKSAIKSQKYLIMDGSAIRKNYAEKMEGIATIYDGSSRKKDKLERGYHWDNIVGVGKTIENEVNILPIYSEIYSKNLDKDYQVSENRKILEVHKSLQPYISPDSILVLDRGYDRMTLIIPFLERSQNFIIRQTGIRHLVDIEYNQSISLKRLSNRTRLSHTYTVNQIRNGRKKQRIFNTGAIRVNFPNCKDNQYLWLITAKESGKGKTWFLSYLNTDDEKEAINTTMEGYKYRWKVEEFHRQVKQDFNLNKIKVMKYDTIKSVGALLLITMGFIAKFFNMMNKGTKLKIFEITNLIYKNTLEYIPNYIYYKATEAIRLLLNIFFKRRKSIKENNFSYNHQPLLDL